MISRIIISCLFLSGLSAFAQTRCGPGTRCAEPLMIIDQAVIDQANKVMAEIFPCAASKKVDWDAVIPLAVASLKYSVQHDNCNREPSSQKCLSNYARTLAGYGVLETLQKNLGCFANGERLREIAYGGQNFRFGYPSGEFNDAIDCLKFVNFTGIMPYDIALNGDGFILHVLQREDDRAVIFDRITRKYWAFNNRTGVEISLDNSPFPENEYATDVIRGMKYQQLNWGQDYPAVYLQQIRADSYGPRVRLTDRQEWFEQTPNKGPAISIPVGTISSGARGAIANVILGHWPAILKSASQGSLTRDRVINAVISCSQLKDSINNVLFEPKCKGKTAVVSSVSDYVKLATGDLETCDSKYEGLMQYFGKKL